MKSRPELPGVAFDRSPRRSDGCNRHRRCSDCCVWRRLACGRWREYHWAV